MGYGLDVLNLLATCIHLSEPHFTDHWHRLVSSIDYTGHFLAMASTEGDFSASHTQVLLSLLPIQNSYELPALSYPGSRLAAISHQPSSLFFTGWLLTELSHSPTSSYFMSLHSTELLTTQPTSDLLLQTLLLMTSWHGPHRKYCSSVVVLVSVAVETCLLSCCLETGCITLFFYCCMCVYVGGIT
jgi:hypothetical protein